MEAPSLIPASSCSTTDSRRRVPEDDGGSSAGAKAAVRTADIARRAPIR